MARRSSSPRIPWDWPPRDSLGVPKSRYREYLEDTELCQSLVALFSDKLGLRLILVWNNNKDGVEAFITENGEIHIPKMHPNRKELVKHEISHAAFYSNFRQMKIFCRVVVDCLDPLHKLTPSAREHLKKNIGFLVNIFDDVRVDSCWAEVFPGDGRKLDDWHTGEIGPEVYAKTMEKYPNGDVSSFSLYCILLLLEQPAKSSRWKKYKNKILQAAEDVKLASFMYCLIVIKDLILDVLREELKDKQQQSKKKNNVPMPPNLQGKGSGDCKQKGGGSGQNSDNWSKDMSDSFASDAAADIVKDFAKGSPSTMKKPISQNAGYDFNRMDETPIPDVIDITKFEDDFHKGNVDKKKCKTSGEKEISSRVQEMIKAEDNVCIGTNSGGKVTGAETMHALESDFSVLKITKGSVVINDTEMRTISRKMRMAFQKIKGKKRRQTEMAGSNLNLPNVIRNKISYANMPYYNHTVNQFGYELIVILDCSYSMSPSKEDIERLFITIRNAVKGLREIEFKVFAFHSTKHGVTNIITWDNTDFVFGGELKIDGCTPLPQAIHYVRQIVSTEKKRKSVLVIGDGEPVFVRRDGTQVLRDNLQWWTRQEVDVLKKLGIDVFALMIGSHLPSDQEMDTMFVSRERWVKIPREELLSAALEYVRTKFVTSLQFSR